MSFSRFRAPLHAEPDIERLQEIEEEKADIWHDQAVDRESESETHKAHSNMGDQSKIQWTDSTVNFWSGCTKVSEGCAHCYAETLSNNKFFGGGQTIGKWGKGAPRKLHESAFKLAFSLNRKPLVCDGCGTATAESTSNQIPKVLCRKCVSPTSFHRGRIFSLSLGDWLDAEVSIEWLARMLDTIRQCDKVTWILCTKRPENWFVRLGRVMDFWCANASKVAPGQIDWICDWLSGVKIPKHITLLASVENQKTADERIPALLKIPAACHGLSMEPLLESVDLMPWLGDHDDRPVNWGTIDWLIIGFESGSGARPGNIAWIRSLITQGHTAGVSTFVKQLGAKPITDCAADIEAVDCSEPTDGQEIRIDLKDKKGGDLSEWPADLRVRQFPKEAA